MKYFSIQINVGPIPLTAYNSVWYKYDIINHTIRFRYNPLRYIKMLNAGLHWNVQLNVNLKVTYFRKTTRHDAYTKLTYYRFARRSKKALNVLLAYGPSIQCLVKFADYNGVIRDGWTRSTLLGVICVLIPVCAMHECAQLYVSSYCFTFVLSE